MDGAVVYDSKEKKIIYTDIMDKEKAHILRNVLWNIITMYLVIQ